MKFSHWPLRIAPYPLAAAERDLGLALAAVIGAVVVATACGSSNGSSHDGGGGSGGNGGGGATEECLSSANVAKAESLTSGQPAIEVRSKSSITETLSFPSETAGSDTTCSVDLQFKDLNDNGKLDPYEDWRKTDEERSTDLLGRMTLEQKAALLLHPSIADVPTNADTDPSASVADLIDSGVRFGRTSANAASVIPRATWANNVQELCEASPLGIPFILSSEPCHSSGNGRVKAKGFSQWPHELGLAAGRDLTAIENFGKIVSEEYRAIGIRMALSVSADLFTDPRWYDGQFTFGEDSSLVSDMVEAYVKGLQGSSLGATSVASVVGRYPGAGAAKGGVDARLDKGKYLSYPGNNLDAHLAPFERAIAAGATGIMPGYGILETGDWTGLDGLIDGATLEQVGVSFNQTLLTDVLRTHSEFTGIVVAPWGVLEDSSANPPAAPWGVESLTKAQRLAKAVNAGVDQFGGLDDVTLVTDALSDGLISEGEVDAAAQRALRLGFELGLFEDPYVEADEAGALVNTDTAYRAGLYAMNSGMVLVVNADKPSGWLNGGGDGSQSGDKGNAGNGTRKVLPAPPGEPYVRAGCSFYVMGNFDLDYVSSVAAGYGTLTNNATSINGVPVTTAAERIALSDYVFIRMAAPFVADTDSGSLELPGTSLAYTAPELDAVATARAAVDAWDGKTPASQTQIVVGIDGGRLPVASALLDYGISGLYIQWAGTLPSNQFADKVFFDVGFGIVDGTGTLPVGMPLSDASVSTQLEDMPKDGQDSVFVFDHGFSTPMFE